MRPRVVRPYKAIEIMASNQLRSVDFHNATPKRFTFSYTALGIADAALTLVQMVRKKRSIEI